MVGVEARQQVGEGKCDHSKSEARGRDCQEEYIAEEGSRVGLGVLSAMWTIEGPVSHLTVGMSDTTRYTMLMATMRQTEIRTASVGPTSTFNGHSGGKCKSLLRWVSLYLSSTWPAHPTAAVAVAMASRE